MQINQSLNFLINHWKSLDINEGDTILVHSSLKQLFVKLNNMFPNSDNTIDTIANSLITAVGKSGTILLPLFNFTSWPNEKYFNHKTTKTEMGALGEYFRNLEGTVRSGHPIYSFAAYGNKSNDFNIINISGYGNDSPFAILEKMNAKILVIGLPDSKCMTTYHYVEEKYNVSYRYFKEFPGTYIDSNHNESQRTFVLFVRNIQKGVQTDVDRMMNKLWELGYYIGDLHNQGIGARTIKIVDLIREVSIVITNQEEIKYLYSIKNNNNEN